MEKVAKPNEDARPRLLNAEQLSREIGCSRSHVFEMAAQGKIPSYRVGRLLRFSLDEVLAATRAVTP